VGKAKEITRLGKASPKINRIWLVALALVVIAIGAIATHQRESLMIYTSVKDFMLNDTATRKIIGPVFQSGVTTITLKLTSEEALYIQAFAFDTHGWINSYNAIDNIPYGKTAAVTWTKRELWRVVKRLATLSGPYQYNSVSSTAKPILDSIERQLKWK
jgi:hypothetical protein